jgi:hypothetical protein
MDSQMIDFWRILFWLSFLPSALFLGYIIRRYVIVARLRPKISKEEIAYEEWFASGASLKNILTKLGGARNCLRLVVTGDLLWVTSWFPFSVIAVAYDLEHVISLRSITSVEPIRAFGIDYLLLLYTDDSGRSHRLRLAPKDGEQFLKALKFEASRSKAPNAV